MSTESRQEFQEHEEPTDANGLYSSDDMESVDSSFVLHRHPRDSTYSRADENGLEETGYMPQSEKSRAGLGIKHSRSKSVLSLCDAKKLLQVSLGYCAHGLDYVGDETEIRREYVEEAELIHESVFDELRRVFPDLLQLQRLLRLDGIAEWDGWNQIKSLL